VVQAVVVGTGLLLGAWELQVKAMTAVMQVLGNKVLEAVAVQVLLVQMVLTHL
jgi:hypothetical protein